MYPPHHAKYVKHVQHVQHTPGKARYVLHRTNCTHVLTLLYVWCRGRIARTGRARGETVPRDACIGYIHAPCVKPNIRPLWLQLGGGGTGSHGCGRRRTSTTSRAIAAARRASPSLTPSTAQLSHEYRRRTR